jgi:hypothetical protein
MRDAGSWHVSDLRLYDVWAACPFGRSRSTRRHKPATSAAKPASSPFGSRSLPRANTRSTRRFFLLFELLLDGRRHRLLVFLEQQRERLVNHSVGTFELLSSENFKIPKCVRLDMGCDDMLSGAPIFDDCLFRSLAHGAQRFCASARWLGEEGSKIRLGIKYTLITYCKCGRIFEF